MIAWIYGGDPNILKIHRSLFPYFSSSFLQSRWKSGIHRHIRIMEIR